MCPWVYIHHTARCSLWSLLHSLTTDRRVAAECSLIGLVTCVFWLFKSVKVLLDLCPYFLSFLFQVQSRISKCWINYIPVMDPMPKAQQEIQELRVSLGKCFIPLSHWARQEHHCSSLTSATENSACSELLGSFWGFRPPISLPGHLLGSETWQAQARVCDSIHQRRRSQPPLLGQALGPRFGGTAVSALAGEDRPPPALVSFCCYHWQSTPSSHWTPRRGWPSCTKQKQSYLHPNFSEGHENCSERGRRHLGPEVLSSVSPARSSLPHSPASPFPVPLHCPGSCFILLSKLPLPQLCLSPVLFPAIIS